MGPAESRMLASYSRTFGLREPAGGYQNLALDDSGVPVDRRYAGAGWSADHGDMSGYDGGFVDNSYLLEP
jgi:hypothetical protein